MHVSRLRLLDRGVAVSQIGTNVMCAENSELSPRVCSRLYLALLTFFSSWQFAGFGSVCFTNGGEGYDRRARTTLPGNQDQASGSRVVQR